MLKESLADQEEKLDVEYAKADLKATVVACTHLNNKERRKLYRLLSKFKSIFDGTLAEMSECNYYINMKQDAPESIQKRCYPVLRCQEDMLKKEIERLCEIGILRKLMGEEV